MAKFQMASCSGLSSFLQKMRKEHVDAVQMYNAPANIKPQAIEEPKIG